MAYSVQNCVDDISYEYRLQLDGTGGSGADFNLIVRWIDQVHKDLLHGPRFIHMLRRRTTITSVSGTYNYNITPTDIARVDAVYNRAGLAFLSPLEDLFAPANIADPAPKFAARPAKEIATTRTSTPYPQYYRIETTVTSGTPAHVLLLHPTPAAAEHEGTVDIFYTRFVSTVSTAGTNLEVGDDGRDAMVAGVLARLYSYNAIEEKAQYWSGVYMRLRSGDSFYAPTQS